MHSNQLDQPRDLKSPPRAEVEFVFGGIDHVPHIMPIMRSAFSEEYGEAWKEAQCIAMLGLPGTRLMQAFVDKKIVGFAISRYVLDEEELLLFAVDPAFRKQGFGKAIMMKFVEVSENNGASSLFLEVRENNPARALYKKLGFTKIGVRPSYYKGANNQRFDAITYKKHLK